jgi:hypothetical protein
VILDPDAPTTCGDYEARVVGNNTQPMVSVLQIASPDAIRRIQRVQTVTIAWMSVEATISLFVAWRARSPALLAFGGDSAIPTVVLWRFRTGVDEHAERRAARVAGTLLFALAAFVAFTSVTSLLGYGEPEPTLLGIAILVAAAVVNVLSLQGEPSVG